MTVLLCFKSTTVTPTVIYISDRFRRAGCRDVIGCARNRQAIAPRPTDPGAGDGAGVFCASMPAAIARRIPTICHVQDSLTLWRLVSPRGARSIENDRYSNEAAEQRER